MTFNGIMCRFSFASLVLVFCACGSTTGPADPCVLADTVAVLNVAGDTTVTIDACMTIDHTTFLLP